jgi:N,N-dimethylformamidase beta subunit-like, C-terminal/Concanavalin A-like lectin/glucanases superfamily
MEIVGYSDPLSVAPGDSIRFMVSTLAPSFAAALVRLAGAGGPNEIPSDVDGEYAGRAQELRPGSYIVVEDTPPLEAGTGFTLEAWVWPAAPGGRPQALAGCYDGTRGYALAADDVGAAALYLDGQVVAAGEPLRRRAWHHVTASYDAASGRVRVVQQPLEEWPGAAERVASEAAVEPWSPAAAPFLLAAWGNPADAHFNGKLEAPRLLDADGLLVAGWGLGGDHGSEHVEDLSGGGRHGRCVNLPMRAVTGHTWCGRTTDAGQAPADYAAIWFHDDDLEDARWEPSFELRVPESIPSGAYAMRVSTADADDELPFFVRPSRGTATADIAVLMPTLSYLAYGNEHNSWANPIPATPGLDQILASVGERDRYMHEQRLKSIYELHTDGSGVAYASRLRPILNMRSDYAMPLLLGGPHQFPADLELLEWLDRREHRYDVLTDEDLHTEGVELLASYRVLLTGSHPEYWTQEMLDVLEGWLAQGGRLMYLGGNGFYWVTSIFRSKPHVLEVRRGHAGTGVWRSEPGEVHHASTGEPGGLWRFRGRAPQRVAGVGFTAQGFDESLPYRRTPESREPRVAWIFDGVEGDEFGMHGSVLGGAAGFEIDRLDTELGTPPHAVVLAVARGFSDVYQATSEDILTSDSKQGGTVSPFVRSDLVFFETQNGGAVFSTGSIAWCGALLTDDGDNAVARITENVLRRFARAGPVDRR